MDDRAALEARLRRLRRQLDEYGAYRPGEGHSWGELVDLYDATLEEAASALGLTVPDPPGSSITRRFTRAAREQLEAALVERGVHVR
jgi:hypothetical protein